MSNESATTVKDTTATKPEDKPSPGFVRRYRLPLFLGFVAICLYASSILYILFGRGVVV